MHPSRTCMRRAHAGTSKERLRREQPRRRLWRSCSFAYRWVFKLAPKECRSSRRSCSGIRRKRKQGRDPSAGSRAAGQGRHT